MSKMLYTEHYELMTNYLNHSNQSRRTTEYVCETLPTFYSGFDEKSHIELIDIGCNNGYQTIPIVESIRAYDKSIHTYALDTSESLINHFKEVYPYDDVDFIVQSWDKYHPTQKFDVILSIHTLYYLDDWEAVIKKILRFKKPDGIVCLVVRADDEVLQFKNQFMPLVNPKEKKERDFSYLCELLHSMRVSFQPRVIDSELDISGLLKDEHSGRLLMEYFLRTSYDSIPPNIQRQIQSYWKAYKDRRKLQLRDGFVWII